MNRSVAIDFKTGYKVMKAVKKILKADNGAQSSVLNIWYHNRNKK